MIFAVVPLKSFRSAKTRLAGRLDEDRRAALARASAVRVLSAVAGCEAIDRRLAVVEDEEAARLVRFHGFEALERPGLLGQSAAVEEGFEHARRAGAKTLLTVSADVPLARAKDLDELLSPPGPVLVMVSNLAGEGTNALRLSPAIPFRLHFGPGSLAQHRREAELSGLPVRVLNNARMRIDVDTPDDLDALEKSGPEGRRVIIDAGKQVREVHLERDWALNFPPR